jgi:hypothetical protein
VSEVRRRNRRSLRQETYIVAEKDASGAGARETSTFVANVDTSTDALDQIDTVCDIGNESPGPGLACNGNAEDAVLQVWSSVMISRDETWDG